MDKVKQFYSEREKDVEKMGEDGELQKKSLEWMIHADKYKYTYNYTWMGQPIVKYPNDMLIQQELMWKLKPDLIIETGIAHGGSIIFSASMQKMMGIDGEVVGVDIDIRSHNRELIENHPTYDRITMYEGDSTDSKIVELIEKHTVGKKCVMVVLDSHHSHDHVYKELQSYSKFVTLNSYCILPDTFIEFFPKGYFSKNRPWDVGDNPHTAMKKFMDESDEFVIDKKLTNKAMITESIDGYLLKVK